MGLWLHPTGWRCRQRHEFEEVRTAMAARITKAAPITCAFLDVGGVLLTDGWDRNARKRAAKTLKLDLVQLEERHHLAFETYEEGKLTLEEYLGLVVFYEKRPFTQAQFRRFMFAQTKPYPEMLALAAELKLRHGLKIAVVSNEARELNEYRIQKFELSRFADFFVTSCFVHIRKPDANIFRLALDMAQTPAQHVVYLDNTPMFVHIAESLGIRSILHTDYASTCTKLTLLGLPLSRSRTDWRGTNGAQGSLADSSLRKARAAFLRPK